MYTIGGNGQAGYSGDGGLAKDAELNYPTDVYETDDHEILIADSRNHVIRKISAIGYIETVVGTGVAGNSPDGTVATSAKVNTPSGIAFVESTRTLYIADTYNHQIKKVKLERESVLNRNLCGGLPLEGLQWQVDFALHPCPFLNSAKTIPHQFLANPLSRLFFSLAFRSTLIFFRY